MSGQRTIPTVAEMVAYGQSFGLTMEQIQSVFRAVTGRDTTAGWVPNVTECGDWARAMERIAEEGRHGR